MGRRAVISPGLTRAKTGSSPTPLEVVGRPIDRLVAVLAKRHFFAFTFDQGCVLTTCSFVSHARRAWPIPSGA